MSLRYCKKNLKKFNKVVEDKLLICYNVLKIVKYLTITCELLN